MYSEAWFTKLILNITGFFIYSLYCSINIVLQSLRGLIYTPVSCYGVGVYYSHTKSLNITPLLFLFLRTWIKKCKFPSKRIEFILEGNLLEKSVKPWIVKRPFCCTVSILQVYFTYLCYITFWALEHHFIENLKLILKENHFMK